MSDTIGSRRCHRPTIFIAFSTADLATVLLTAAVPSHLRRTRIAQRVARLVGGSIMIGLGLRLATRE
jgi:threonine/homoserine/homoserine lactone efflux protein